MIPARSRPAASLALLAVAGCALTGQPGGGDLDATPPRLDTLGSSPNFVTDARPEALTLAFDEYVQLKNPTRDIVLTPTPREGRPRFVARGREVRVDLSEVVYRDSTTYQLQFGTALQDLNEGNPAANLKYVFSTGPYLDSLELRGTVRDAEEGAPAIAALVGLYRSLSDTALVRSAPDYFTRTDSSGRFALDYLSAGTYQLASYLDENANYRLAQGAEQVAFLDTTVTVAPGLPDTAYALTLSLERPPLIAMRADQAFPGLLRVVLNQPADDPRTALYDAPGTALATYAAGDTLFRAYAPPLDSLGEVVVGLLGETDTARVRDPERGGPPPVRAVGRALAVAGEATLAQAFNLPLRGVDASRVRVASTDSVAYPPGTWAVDTLDPRRLRWDAPTDTVSTLRVTWLPGALTTVFDSTNRDTLTADYNPRRASEFGEIALTIAGLDTGRAYALELLRDGTALERRVRLAPRQDRVTLARVAGGNYAVRIVEDLDGDGRYTPGSRRLRLQPERGGKFPLQEVRPDWIVEEEINAEPIFAPFGVPGAAALELLD